MAPKILLLRSGYCACSETISSFDLLPLGMLVGGTDVVDDGQFIFLGKMRDSLFSDIEHGADLRDAGAAEIRYGLKAADAALVEKAHEKCFNGIVKMVTERDLVAAQFQQHVVQRTAAHFRAHRTRVFLVPVIKDNRADLQKARKYAIFRAFSMPEIACSDGEMFGF